IRTVELRVVDGTVVTDLSPEQLQLLRSTFDARGLAVCAIASPYLKCDRGEDHERILERAIDAARALGAPIVRAVSWWREPDPSGVLPDLGAALHRTARRVHDAGLTLALENEHDCNVGSGAEAAAALDAAASPYLRLIWDAGNAAMLDPETFAGLGGLD